jgi:hypothetical protein
MVGVGTEVDAEEIVGSFAAILVRLIGETIDGDDTATAAEADAEFTMEIEVVGAIEIVGTRETTKSIAADLALGTFDPALAAVFRVSERIDADVVTGNLGRPAGEAVSVLTSLTRTTLAGVATPAAALGAGRTLRSLSRRALVTGNRDGNASKGQPGDQRAKRRPSACSPVGRGHSTREIIKSAAIHPAPLPDRFALVDACRYCVI